MRERNNLKARNNKNSRVGFIKSATLLMHPSAGFSDILFPNHSKESLDREILNVVYLLNNGKWFYFNCLHLCV